MSAAIALGGFTGPEADTLGYAIRKKKSSVLRAQKEKFVTQAAERGVPAGDDRRGLQGVRAVRALRLQQGPRHLLRPGRLPDGLPQGELHRRVHDQRPDRGPRHGREGRRGDRRVPPDGDRGPAPGRPPLRRRVHGRGRRDPVRPARGQERRPGRDRVDHRRPRGGRPVPVADRLLLADRPAAGEPEGPRGAGQGRRAQRLRASRPRSCSASTTRWPPAPRPSATGSRARPRCSRWSPSRPPSTRPLPIVPETPTRERLRWEKELLGLYLSDHPLGEIAEAIGPYVTAYSGDLRDESLDQQRVVVGGIVTGVRTVITKAKATMAIVSLEDLQGGVEVVVFPRLFEESRPHLDRGTHPPRRGPGRPQGRGGLAPRRPRRRLGRGGRPGPGGLRPRRRRGRPLARPGRPVGGNGPAGRVGRRPVDARSPAGRGRRTVRAGRVPRWPSVRAQRPWPPGSSVGGQPAAVGSGRARRAGRWPSAPSPARRVRRPLTCPGSPRPSRCRPTSPRPAIPDRAGSRTTSRRCPTRPGHGRRAPRGRRPCPSRRGRTRSSTSGSARARRRGAAPWRRSGRSSAPARGRPGWSCTSPPDAATRSCRWSCGPGVAYDAELVRS